MPKRSCGWFYSLALVWLLVACTAQLQPTATLAPTRTPTPLPSPTPAASPTPTATPTETALFRGISSYDATRRFTLTYPLPTWQMDWGRGGLVHQATGCLFSPEAGGSGLGPEWTCTGNLVTVGSMDFERRTCTETGRTVPGLVSYGVTAGETYFLFLIDTGDLDQTAFDRCRADAEAVLATFTPLEPLTGEFAALGAALDVYEPPSAPQRATMSLTTEVARWLSQGNDPADLEALLRTLPKLDAADPRVMSADLNGDGRRDVVLQPNLMGLPVVAYIAQEDGSFAGVALPDTFGEPLPTMSSGIAAQDLTGDLYPETVVTYTVSGGSMVAELLYVFQCSGPTDCPLVFHARLISWAGPSSWTLEPDPLHPKQWQFVLTYPHLYFGSGFDHKMLNHPLGRQVWRWDVNAERFVLAEKMVDMERSGWGPESNVTVEDRLRWLTNEGETAFRAGEYETAVQWYDRALALATSENWGREREQPDWPGYLRFRRAETLALLGRSAEALPEMRAVADDYAGDLLGRLAAAFLSGYGNGSAPDAPARGIAAMQPLAAEMYDRLDYHEYAGALCFPLNTAGILYPGAGLAAYLDAYPEIAGDIGALETGLRELGFPVEGVRFESDDETGDGKALVTLRLPDAPNAEGAPVEWTLIYRAGRWQVAPLPALEWPLVGGFPMPTFEPRLVPQT